MVIMQLEGDDLISKKNICKIKIIVIDMVEFILTFKSMKILSEMESKTKRDRVSSNKINELNLIEGRLLFISVYLDEFPCKE